MASVMDVDEEEVEMASSSSGKGDKKRFEVKKVTIFFLNYASSFFFVLIVSKHYFLCSDCDIRLFPFPVERRRIMGLGYVFCILNLGNRIITCNMFVQDKEQV